MTEAGSLKDGIPPKDETTPSTVSSTASATVVPSTGGSPQKDPVKVEVLPKEIADLTPEEAKAKLASLTKEHVNLQETFGKHSLEVGDLRKRVESATSLFDVIFKGPAQVIPDGKVSPASNVAAAVQNADGKVFMTVEDIEAQFRLDCEDMTMADAILAKDRRMDGFREAKTSVTLKTNSDMNAATSVMKDFLINKDGTPNLVNEQIFNNYMLSLPQETVETYQVVLKNKPLFVKELIKAAEGHNAKLLIAEARKAGAQGATEGFDAAASAGLSTGIGVKQGNETPDSKLGKELLSVKNEGIL